MDRQNSDISIRRIPRGAISGCAIIGAMALLVLSVACWVTYSKYGIPGVVSSVTAALVCAGSAMAALVVTVMFQNTPNAVSGLFFSIFLRTFIPFLVGFVLSQTGGIFADGGIFGQILVFYLILQPIETIIVVRLLGRNAEKSKASS